MDDKNLDSTEVARETHSREETCANGNQNWLRLSPISVVFFLGKSLTHLVKDALPGLAPLIILVANAENKALYGLLGIAGLATLIIVAAILQFWFFRFLIDKDKVLIKQGVFKKQERILSFERIQNINIIQPFYFKPFSLVTLQLETAGSKSNEADLAGISKDLAELLKYKILAKKAAVVAEAASSDQNEINNSSSQTIQGASAQPAELLATANVFQLVKYGVTSNAMFWFLVFLAPFMGMLDDILEKWIGKENMVRTIESLGGGVKGGITLGILIFLGVIVGMILFSIIGSIIRYYKYQLTLQDKTLKRHSGLLSTHEESAKLSKIQAFVAQTNFIGKWLNVENILLKQASGQSNQNNARAGLFVIPTQEPTESKTLLKKCLSCHEALDDLKKINKRYIFKTTMIASLIPVLATTIIFILLDTKLAGLILTLIPVIWLIAKQKWKNYGYQLGTEFAAFRRGFWGYKKVTFPLFKVQRVTIQQSFLQKRRNLTNLEITLASDRIVIPYMPMEDAIEWLDKISYKVETTDRAWF